MLAYCTALGLHEGHLVYAKGNADATSHQVRNTAIIVVTHTLDLGQEPEDLLGQVADLPRSVRGGQVLTAEGARPT